MLSAILFLTTVCAWSLSWRPTTIVARWAPWGGIDGYAARGWLGFEGSITPAGVRGSNGWHLIRVGYVYRKPGPLAGLPLSGSVALGRVGVWWYGPNGGSNLATNVLWRAALPCWLACGLFGPLPLTVGARWWLRRRRREERGFPVALSTAAIEIEAR